MADSQKSMVSIVAIIAIVILVGAVLWFLREEADDDTLEIEIGLSAVELILPAPPGGASHSHLRPGNHLKPDPGRRLHQSQTDGVESRPG